MIHHTEVVKVSQKVPQPKHAAISPFRAWPGPFRSTSQRAIHASAPALKYYTV